MGDRRLKLALLVVLLPLTSPVGCASNAPQPGASSTDPDSKDAPSFIERGVDAPPTAARRRSREAPLDLARLAESVGEAEEVSAEALQAIESRGRSGEERQGSADHEVSSAIRTGASREDRRTQTSDGVPAGDGAPEPAAPPPSARPPEPPAAEPRPSPEKTAMAPSDEESKKELGFSVGGEAGAKLDADKGGAKDGAEKPKDTLTTTKKTVLPEITRAPTTGKILVQSASGGLEAIRPRAIRVLAYVQGPRARTIVDYVFENPHPARLEGTFYYPLPADASPAGFAMFEGTRRIDSESMFQSLDLLPDLGEQMIDPHSLSDTAPQAAGKRTTRAIDWGTRKDARVVEQKRAREVYEDIVRKNIDPALMEWSGGATFQARVFPLEPQGLKRIVVAYEQPLVFDGARYRYGYTLPGEPAIREHAAVVFVDGNHGTVAEPPAGSRSRALGRWTRFELEKPGPLSSLTVAVTPATPSAVLRGRDRSGLPGDTFYAELRPELPRGDETRTERALILVDTSLSSDEEGTHARRAKLIEALLEKDQTIERYAVALFDLRVRWLHGMSWRPNDAPHRAESLRDLRRVYLEGATSFAAVLDELERQRAWAVDGEKTTVFLLSDGEITWGLDRVEALAARFPVLRDVRWITYRFGESPVNGPLFDTLSAESGGRTISLLSEAEVGDAAVAHRAEPAMLEGVTVEGAKVVDLTVAGAPKRIFPGQVLRVAGRLPEGGGGRLVLSYRIGRKVSTHEAPLGSSQSDDHFAPRAWAELHTRRLISLDDVRLDRMVVALSQHYRLANARASFLILDRDAQAEEYRLADETVDLGDLEKLRQAEEDQRRDRLLGIALDEVPSEGRELLELLRRRSDGLAPLLEPQPLLEAPFAGGIPRLEAEVRYREARARERLDYLVYDHIARHRALAGDTAGAVRALSSAVEVKPRDGEAMRLVGYALLALAQYDVAAELFERLRLLRPFEPEAFLEEALALDAAGRWHEAARNYEILLSRSWARHGHESSTTAAQHYGRLLSHVLATGVLPSTEARLVSERLAALRGRDGASLAGARVELQLTTLWSTDGIDIDLWVYEPNGEKCFYSHRDTTLGGHLFWDVTDGLGPELYQAPRAAPGQYDTLVHFYGSNAPRLSAPTAMLMVVDRGSPASRIFQMRMLPKRDAVLMMRTDVIEAR